MTDSRMLTALAHQPLTIVGQLRTASNASLLCTIDLDGQAISCVHKPRAGERPLWDFPEGTLGHREVAAYLVSEALGWNVVPVTVWREEGPFGPGMCQQWIDACDDGPVEIVPADSATGLVIVEGTDDQGNDVALVHEDLLDLQRLAVFDAVINNADRKGGHVLRDANSRLWAIDHGVAFSIEPKLRTVLWGWAGQPVPDVIIGELSAAWDAIDVEVLLGHVSEREIEAMNDRAQGLRATGVFPTPSGQWPALPWPVM